MQYSIQLTKRRMEIGLSKAKCQGRSPQVSGKPSTTDSEEALVGKWSFFVTDFDVTKVQCIQVHLCNTSGTNAVGWEGRRRYNKTVKSSKAFYIAPYAWTWLGLYRVGGATYGPNLADFMPSFEKESAMPLTLLSAQRYLQIGNAPLNFEAACIMSCCLRPRQTH